MLQTTSSSVLGETLSPAARAQELCESPPPGDEEKSNKVKLKTNHHSPHQHAYTQTYMHAYVQTYMHTYKHAYTYKPASNKLTELYRRAAGYFVAVSKRDRSSSNTAPKSETDKHPSRRDTPMWHSVFSLLTVVMVQITPSSPGRNANSALDCGCGKKDANRVASSAWVVSSAKLGVPPIDETTVCQSLSSVLNGAYQRTKKKAA
jgi:hypothetical protein